ncbi:MAG: ABC transporter substrate-binding protein [Gammaproteobacteria bacterium]|nr:ABC transporter substrate-binding protein [Gammaproteobacteria bacterium]
MIRLALSRVILPLVVLLNLQPVLAGDSEPEKLVKQTADEVLEIIKTNQAEFKENPSKLYSLVDEKVLPHFDFNRMTDLALGRYKRKANKTQKPQLVEEFRHLLVRTYGKALLEYNDQTIAYLPMRGLLSRGEVTVRTEIEQKGGFPIPLNYELYKKDNGWKVYDISVDNISLVTNYRSTFAKKIKADGIDGLIKSLQDRNKSES